MKTKKRKTPRDNFCITFIRRLWCYSDKDDVIIAKLSDRTKETAVQERLVAIVKGHLIRQLMKTNQVQNLIVIIKDTRAVIDDLVVEFEKTSGPIQEEDARLLERLTNYLTSAMNQFHDVFFAYSRREQLKLIAISRDRDEPAITCGYRKVIHSTDDMKKIDQNSIITNPADNNNVPPATDARPSIKCKKRKTTGGCL